MVFLVAVGKSGIKTSLKSMKANYDRAGLITAVTWTLLEVGSLLKDVKVTSNGPEYEQSEAEIDDPPTQV